MGLLNTLTFRARQRSQATLTLVLDFVWLWVSAASSTLLTSAEASFGKIEAYRRCIVTSESMMQEVNLFLHVVWGGSQRFESLSVHHRDRQVMKPAVCGELTNQRVAWDGRKSGSVSQ